MLPCTWEFGMGMLRYCGSGSWLFLRSRAVNSEALWGAAFPGRRRWEGRRGQTGFPLDVIVPGDVLLYQHDRRRTFQILGLFCASQFTFWTYLAYVTFTTLQVPKTQQPQPRPKEGEGEKPPPPPSSSPSPSSSPLPSFLQGLGEILGTNKWRYGFTGSCLATGCLIVAAAFLFARRSVSQILLHRGGQEVSFTTYYPSGITSSFRVPLRHISCQSHRSQVSVTIPVKVKGKSFYFLVDKSGQIVNGNLFDLTVGAYRAF